MTASHVRFSAPQLLSAPTLSRRQSTSGVSNPAQSSDLENESDFSQQLRDHLASGEDDDRSTASAQVAAEFGNAALGKQPASHKQYGVATGEMETPATPIPYLPGSQPAALIAPVPSFHKLRGSSQSPAKGPSAPPSSGNKQPKVSQQELTEPSEESDTAQLSLSAQQFVSELKERSAPGDGQPNKQHEDPASKLQESRPTEVSSPTSSSNVTSGDLVVAMRISPENAGALSPEAGPGTAGAAIIKDPSSNGLSRAQLTAVPQSVQEHHQTEAPPPIGATVAINGGSGSADPTKPSAAKETAKVSESGFESELNKASAEPVRAAHVQIAGSDNQRIDIRMLERGGALSVTVRSADSGLSRALQEHAPDLTARLSLENFRTELWAPGQKNQSDREPRGGDPQSQGGGNSGPRNPNQQKQDGKPAPAPEWIEQFEKKAKAFQQRIDYIWHQ